MFRPRNGFAILWGMFLAAVLVFTPFHVFAQLEKDELEKLKDGLADLYKEDPELATAVQAELKEAVVTGEIDLAPKGEANEHGDTAEATGDYDEGLNIDWETPEGKAKAVAEIDSHKEDLLKQGLSEDDVNKLKELVSTGDHDPEKFKAIFEKDGGPMEGDKMGAYKEKMEQGREFGKEMMEKMMLEKGYDPNNKDSIPEHAREEMGREMMERMIQEMAGREGAPEFAGREGAASREFDREMFEKMKEYGPEQAREFGEHQREHGEFAREVSGQEREFFRELEHAGFEREAFEHGGFEREANEKAGLEREALEKAGVEREAFERDAREHYIERETLERERDFLPPPPGENPPPEPPPGP